MLNLTKRSCAHYYHFGKINTLHSIAIHDFKISLRFKKEFISSIRFQAMSTSSEDSPLYGTNDVSSGYESFILKKGGRRRNENKYIL